MKTGRESIAVDFIAIFTGTLFLASGLNIFLVPFKMSPGGVSSIATVLIYLFKIPLSVTNIVINAMLFIFGYKYLKKRAILKAITGIFLLSLSLEITDNFPKYNEDIIIAALSGGVLVGIGLGIVLRKEASTGGSDFAASIFKRFFPHISTARIILLIDFIVIFFSGIIFGSITISVYSLITLYISTKVADSIITLGDESKKVYIISNEYERLSHEITHKHNRGVTGIYSMGMYSGEKTIMLLCIIPPKSLPPLVNTIREIDKKAFIVVSDAREVFGEGFKSIV